MKARFKLHQFYYHDCPARYAVLDTVKQDTVRDNVVGHTLVMLKSHALWLARELNRKESSK